MTPGRVLCVAVAVLLGATAASAGTLTSATWTQTISLPFWREPLQIARSSAQLGATGSSTADSISVAFAFPQLTTSFLIETKLSSASLLVTLTQGGAQTLTATRSMAAGNPGIPGVVLAKLSEGATKALLTVPLSHGRAGRITLNRASTQFVFGDFYGWVPNTVTVTGLSTYSLDSTEFVAMGSFDLTAKGGGTITLVSPSKLYAVGEVGIQGRIHSLTTLKLSFVPEPGVLLLLGAGAVGLVLLCGRS